jgi:GntR family transcriptional regulator
VSALSSTRHDYSDWKGRRDVISIRLNPRSGVPPYRQIIEQVRRAIRYGKVKPGAQLPTARELVAALVVNPNTILKAYRELELAGLVECRPGLGTFIAQQIPRPLAIEAQMPLRRAIRRWLREAEIQGLGPEDVRALVEMELAESEAEAVG